MTSSYELKKVEHYEVSVTVGTTAFYIGSFTDKLHAEQVAKRAEKNLVADLKCYERKTGQAL